MLPIIIPALPVHPILPILPLSPSPSSTIGDAAMQSAHLGRTASLPCIASPTVVLSPSSSPLASALSSPSSTSNPSTPRSSPSQAKALTDGVSTTTTSTARMSFFSLASSTVEVTTTTTASSPSPSPPSSSSSSSLLKSFTRPLLSLYASLRISCLPSETTAAQRLQWQEAAVNVSSPPAASMSDTEMGSIAALSTHRRRVREGGLSEIREVRELRQAQVSRVSRVRQSRNSAEHSRRSSSLSRWRGSASRSSHPPSSPSSALGRDGRLESEECVEEAGSDVDEEREEVTMAVFNASPLVLMDHRSSSITPVSRLDIDGEKEQIRRVMQRTTAPIHCTFHQLTLEVLSEELIAEPDILHLSGHGLHTADGQYALALEHDNGSVSLLSMPSLSRLLSALPHLPKLVVILACHSESAGQVFADAGVEHVVCVRGSERILDSSAKYWTRFFYAALLGGFSVAKAFEVAVRNVEIVFDIAGKKGAGGEPLTPQPTTPSSSLSASASSLSPPSMALSATVPLPMSRSLTALPPLPESAKFALLPAGSTHASVLFAKKYPRRCAASHRGGGAQCTSPAHGHSPSLSSMAPVARPRHSSPGLASATSLMSPMSPMSPLPPSWSPSSEHSNLPSRPTTIVGREVEVQRIVGALLSHRLVNVYGRDKSGRTSVALLAAHFQRERGRYDGGVYYVSMRGVGGMDSKVGETDDDVKAREQRLAAHLAYVLGLEDAKVRSLRQLFQLIRDSDVLVVFDDCSSSPSYSFLLSLLLGTTRPKVMAISDCDARHYFALDSRQSTASVEVAALSPAACLQLIRRLCQENAWLMKEGEMAEFAALCGWQAWDIVVRMRRVAMKENEAATARPQLCEVEREESVRGREEEEERVEEEGEEGEGSNGQDEREEAGRPSALRPMKVGDFIAVIEVATIPRL